MSNAPFYVMKHRKGNPFGEQKLIDGLAHDGLIDPYCNFPMGLVAEKTATELSISRDVLDAYAISSYERVIQSEKDGLFKPETVAVTGDQGQLSFDEEVKNYRKEKLPQLKPAFSKTGVNTAGNSSKLSDGACSLVLVSEEALKRHSLKPLARILSYADA